MDYEVAIVGAGPGGLSAAARARALGLSHVLLEASAAPANTIQRYQRGKHVMAEPDVVPLRSDLEFSAGTREKVLSSWDSAIKRLGINLQFESEVTSIEAAAEGLHLDLTGGKRLRCHQVILAIGLQGNPRRLGVPGEDAPCVQYTLDDPDEYRDETIVIVGAGDAAIENAIGLADHNNVVIVNRRDEFARAKEGNLRAITSAIEEKRVECAFSTTIVRLEQAESKRPAIVLSTPDGETRVECDRVIARLGAIPPRRFVESCGIRFPSDDPTSLPELSTRYESNVPGLYVIGALGGYPLIKQAMNQGYEVVEFIAGNEIRPADHPLLEKKFAALPFGRDVDDTLTLLQQQIPVLEPVNALVFRELVLASEVLQPLPGELIFAKDDYTNSFICIVQGDVAIERGAEQSATLAAGNFFGEMSLLSGRRRSATARAGRDCILLEFPRREILKLMNSYDAVKVALDKQFVIRALQSSVAPDARLDELAAIADGARLEKYSPGEAIFQEGDEATSFHLVRSGSLAVSKKIGGKDIVTSYVAAGNYVGEMGLLGNRQRTATVKANVATETISLDAATFRSLLEQNPGLRETVQETVRERLNENARMEAAPEAGDIISFLMQQGLGEATDVLLIDETLCIGCDNCEKACAETHDGTSRLDRAAGPTYAKVHVPTSCRHCEDPHCMTDCPPDAIRRAPNGEVYIQDNCIGCGNCERNCPYGVIQMASEPEEAPSLVSWLLFGTGAGPGERKSRETNASEKKAVKCDMCKDLAGGPACVRACPTGAAIRTSPKGFMEIARRQHA